MAVTGLSIEERDRRWALARSLMDRHGLGLLIVGGFRSRDHYEHFMSNDYIEGAVIFPRNGSPVALSWSDSRVRRAQESFARGVEPWIDDYRAGVHGTAVAGLIRELSADGPVGIVGRDAQTAGEFSGFIPARFWIDLTEGLPDREIVDISWDFNEMMLPRSEEELGLLRYSAAAAEAASEVMLDVARPGLSESDLYAHILHALYSRGCNVRYPTLILHSGYENLSWGPPRWTTTAEPIRQFADQDLVQAEIFPTYGNIEVQVQMSVALGKPDPKIEKCAAVARDSYEAGIAMLKAGVTFGQLVSAMEGPLKASGCWAMTPLVHTVNPQSFIGITHINREGAPTVPALPGPRPQGKPPVAGQDLVLPAGTSLAFEPNACIDRTRVNIGGTVVVTETGCEELNTLPCHMQIKQ